MKDPNYVFKQEDVINEVKDGYIIKVDGNYYLYLKENSDHKNIRTKEQIVAEREKERKRLLKSIVGRVNTEIKRKRILQLLRVGQGVILMDVIKQMMDMFSAQQMSLMTWVMVS